MPLKRLQSNALWFAERFVCLFLPLASLIFYISAPHGGVAALLWTLPVWVCVIADVYSPSARKDPDSNHSGLLFEAALYIQVFLQVVNIYMMLVLVSRLQWSSFEAIAVSIANLFTIRILTGTTSCCSAIAVAHELIHRRNRFQHALGRLLLLTVCYDHFSVEHLFGHHRRASLPEDHATARFGETYADFWKRTVKGQFLHAWQLESERLKGRSMIRHKVLQGLILEFGLIILIGLNFGLLATWMFLYQAFYAVRLLESVNYFQHWGLVRAEETFGVSDAWKTDSWMTLHSFVGLSRHADHHMFDDKPYHRLNYRDEGPRLPYGYFAMYILVKFFNGRYQVLAKQALESSGRLE